MSIDPIIRDRCVIDGSLRLAPLHTFPQFPVWMGCTDAAVEDDLRHDMCWAICEDCGTIQLTELIPLDILYANSHNSGVVGSLWKQHHQAFADFVLEHKPNTVLEIGGGHGILSVNCHAVRPEIDWTILEPNPTPQPGCRARYIPGFFDSQFKFDRAVDTVVHSHFMEHLYSPKQFLEAVQGFLPVGGRHLFSIPNLPEMLNRCYTNCINFEHTYFIDEEMLEAVLANHGLKLCDKEKFYDDHSIFYATERVITPFNVRLPDSLDRNRLRYQAYLDYHRTLVDRLNSAIIEHDGPVYLFGAHVFSQYLIAFGLDSSRICMILDNDTMKHGKRLSGTDLQVAGPKVLAGLSNALLILRAGVYTEEIRREILTNINSRVVII